MQSNRSGSVQEDRVGQRVLVLGIGNLLWADEGFGVRAVDFLRDNYVLDDSVTLTDGCTQGIYLVQYIRDADILVVFDAVDMALAYLAGFGIQARRRAEPLKADTAASGAISDIHACEAESPSDRQACRKGDARVLESEDFQLAYRPTSIDGVSVGVDQHPEKYREPES